MAIDLGTGDGRFVLAHAAARPDRLVIGVDAAATAMAEASRRAGRPPRKGGLPNVLFVVAAAEALPAALSGNADAVTIHFPWGSLLRGLLRPDAAILGGLARVTRPGATLTLLLSVTARDRAMALPELDACTFPALAPTYAAHGLALTEARPATAGDLAAAHSTWGKRLGADGTRCVWVARFTRHDAAAPPTEQRPSQPAHEVPILHAGMHHHEGDRTIDA